MFRLFVSFSLTNFFFLVMNQNSVRSDMCSEMFTDFILFLAVPRGQCWRFQVVFFYRQTAYRFHLVHFICAVPNNIDICAVPNNIDICAVPNNIDICAVPNNIDIANFTALYKKQKTQLMMMIQNINNYNSNNTK